MSREDPSADVGASGAQNALMSPARATIATPKWKRVGIPNGSPDGLKLDVERSEPQPTEPAVDEEDWEDTSDEAFLRRHDDHALEERKRWLPADSELKTKSPSSKKRLKLRASMPIFPTPYHCYELVTRSVERRNRALKMRRIASEDQKGTPKSSPASDKLPGGKQANGHAVNGSAHQKNGKRDQCLVITMESFKRLQDVLSREKDYFNRVLKGLEKCIRENEPSIAIHTDIDRKVVFSREDFDHLIQNVKYSFESIDGLQSLLREKSDGLKKETKRQIKLDRAQSVRNGKSKHVSASPKTGESLVPADYALSGQTR